jgi:predicted nuclease with TOPRIM domain
MSKRGYYRDTIELIAVINIKAEKEDLKDVLLKHKDSFEKIHDKIKQIEQYNSVIKPAYEKRKKETTELLKITGAINTLFEVFYLELLKVLKNAFIAFQQTMAICLYVSLIDIGIKEYEGGK